ncbi:PhoH family protein [Methyloversatilis sp.]|uniref:PhoH family protein n=1 Tax=Methyloversatilis sp. TaxID=2569862 RepID=UPI0035B04CAA
MSRNVSRKPKQRMNKSQRSIEAEFLAHIEEPTRVVPKKAEPLSAKTEKQRKYISSIRSSKITFGIGPAGTGKTYVAGAVACDMLVSGQIEKIIITRPAVDAGESLGFLPGELEEKYEPYIAAFRDVLNERLGKTYVEYLIKMGKIEGMPFAYMRGKTFKNCVVILDEAQNTTKLQFKLFLTRIGENCRVVIDGDPTQTDIPNSGLNDAINRISHIPDVRVIEFSRDDVVRSGIVSEIIQAYEDK